MPEVPNRAAQGIAPKQRRVVGRPFVKGDPRCNRSGRPKSFDHFRELALAIANGKTGGVTKARQILSRWADSPEPMLQKAFIEYAFGKVPDKLETTGLENKTTLVLHFDHERGITEESNGR